MLAWYFKISVSLPSSNITGVFSADFIVMITEYFSPLFKGMGLGILNVWYPEYSTDVLNVAARVPEVGFM